MSSLKLILYYSLLHRINVAVKSRVKAITTRHLNKLTNLRNKRSTYSSNSNHISFIKNTVYNMSFYTLTEDEYNTLAFGLDQHIPTRTNKNIIDTEFELYYQSINRYVNNIPDNKISYLKTKLRNIGERYAVNSTKEFIEMIKKERVPSSYKMISFDVSSLFTMVPLDYTIDLTLKQIYGYKEIETKISRKDMKNMLSHCAKDVRFTFGNNIYQQKDDAAMGSPLGPVLSLGKDM